MIVTLVACQGRRENSGLDAVSRDGRWISLVEPAEGTPPAQLTLVDMQAIQSPLVVERTDYHSDAISSFSPDGRFLLYKGDIDWMVLDIESGDHKGVAPLGLNVEFLLNDELLITDWQTITPTNSTTLEQRIQVWVTTPQNPQSRRLITDQGRYYFVSQGTRTSSVLSMVPASSFPAQVSCPRNTLNATEARVIVNADRGVTVLQANRQRLNIEELSKLSNATIDVLNAHESLMRSLSLIASAASTPESGKLISNFSAAELARLALAGLASPDGSRLSLISTTPIGDDKYRYSLDLLNLEKDLRVTLSSNTDWAPGFLFSPDGSQILYESSIEGTRTWYLAESDGSGKHPVPLSGATTVCWH